MYKGRKVLCSTDGKEILYSFWAGGEVYYVSEKELPEDRSKWEAHVRKLIIDYLPPTIRMEKVKKRL